MESRSALLMTLQLAQDIHTTDVFYCYKIRGQMPFFRANLIGLKAMLKADRDKKEIGTTAVLVDLNLVQL